MLLVTNELVRFYMVLLTLYCIGVKASLSIMSISLPLLLLICRPVAIKCEVGGQEMGEGNKLARYAH